MNNETRKFLEHCRDKIANADKSNGSYFESCVPDLLDEIDAMLAEPDLVICEPIYQYQNASGIWHDCEKEYFDSLSKYAQSSTKKRVVYIEPPKQHPLTHDEIFQMGNDSGFSVDWSENEETGEQEYGFLNQFCEIDNSCHFKFAQLIQEKYVIPPKRKPLTDVEIRQILFDSDIKYPSFIDVARMVEKHHDIADQ